MLNYPTNRTDALARLPAKERDLRRRSTTPFSPSSTTTEREGLRSGGDDVPPVQEARWRAGVANAVASAADPVRIKLIPAEATIARLSVEFSYAGCIRATNGGHFLFLFGNGTTAVLQAQQEEAAMEAEA